MKNSSNTKYKMQNPPFNLFINLYFTVIACILTLNHTECEFCLSDPRIYVTLQSSVRTEEWKCQKWENSEQNGLDPTAFLASFVDISLKLFFSLWLKKENQVADFLCMGLKSGIAEGRYHLGGGSCCFLVAFIYGDLSGLSSVLQVFFHPECFKTLT